MKNKETERKRKRKTRTKKERRIPVDNRFGFGIFDDAGNFRWLLEGCSGFCVPRGVLQRWGVDRSPYRFAFATTKTICRKSKIRERQGLGWEFMQVQRDFKMEMEVKM